MFLVNRKQYFFLRLEPRSTTTKIVKTSLQTGPEEEKRVNLQPIRGIKLKFVRVVYKILTDQLTEYIITCKCSFQIRFKVNMTLLLDFICLAWTLYNIKKSDDLKTNRARNRSNWSNWLNAIKLMFRLFHLFIFHLLESLSIIHTYTIHVTFDEEIFDYICL